MITLGVFLFIVALVVVAWWLGFWGVGWLLESLDEWWDE